MNLIDKLKGQDLDVLLNQLLKPRSNKLTFEERSKLYSRVRRLVLAGKEYYGALNIIRELTSQRKQTLEIKKRLAVYDMAVQRMRERNVGLGEALAGAIPESEKNLITAAESGSNIEVGLNAAMMISKLSGDIKKAVMMAVLYPAIIFLVIIGGIAFFGQSVLPEFASFMPVDQWSPMGQKLYHLSTTVHIWAPITLGIIFSAVAAYRWSVHKWVGEKREKVDDAIVFYNINKTIQSSIVLISLSAYLQSGIAFVNALRKINNETESLWIKRNLEEIIDLSRNRGSIGEAMVVPMFDEESREDIAIYSRSTPEEFSASLAEIGEAGVIRALERINSLSARIKFILTTIGGGTILTLYISVLSVGNNIQNAM